MVRTDLNSETKKSNFKAGYSLVVVLFSLSILTLIFGVSSTRIFSHLERVQTNQTLSNQRNDALLAAEILLDIGVPEERTLRISVLDREISASLQPATGLVDLNTASPALLRLLFEGFDLPSAEMKDALDKFRDWRREGRKLLRVSDFFRVSGADEKKLQDFSQFVTVYSGRTGIDPKQAPVALLEHLTNSSGPVEDLSATLGLSFATVGSTTNFHLFLNSAARPSAALHFGSNDSQSRILALK